MTVAVEHPADELTPLADYLAGALRRLVPLPPLDLPLSEAHGRVLAEDVTAAGPWPAYDAAAIDGYAVAAADLNGGDTPVRLAVLGYLTAASSGVSPLAAGGCFAVAAGAPLPVAADTVVPAEWTDRGTAVVEIRERPRRGHGVRRTGEELPTGDLLAPAGTTLTPAVLAVLAATGVTQVSVRPRPRVVVLATGDELVESATAAGGSRPGQVVDVSCRAVAAAVVEAGGEAYAGIGADDPHRLCALLAGQAERADLIVTTGGTGTGPGDVVRQVLCRRDGARAPSVTFTELAAYPCGRLGFGTVGEAQVPVVCLPGDPGTALVGFEVLARPAIQVLAGVEPVFRPGVRGHLRESVRSPAGLREFRPALVTERRGGGYTVAPLPGGPHTLAGMARGNALMVLGERVDRAPAGTDVDVLLLDRRR